MSPLRSARQHVDMLRQSVEQYYVDDNYAAFNARNGLLWEEVEAQGKEMEAAVKALLRQEAKPIGPGHD